MAEGWSMKLSDGEKLIIAMLAEIYKALRIKGEINPKFVMSAIYGGNLWGLAHQYSGLFGAEEKRPEVVTETINILDMWRSIEDDWKQLSKSEQNAVIAEIPGISKKPQFTGFDGHDEIEYVSVARFFVEDIGTFQKLKGRDLDSHHPTLRRYRAMYRVFEPMRATLTSPEKTLSSAQMIEIFKAADKSGD
jgi:uncharacterized protein YfbU (UPF0304 family)